MEMYSCWACGTDVPEEAKTCWVGDPFDSYMPICNECYENVDLFERGN